MRIDWRALRDEWQKHNASWCFWKEPTEPPEAEVLQVEVVLGYYDTKLIVLRGTTSRKELYRSFDLKSMSFNKPEKWTSTTAKRINLVIKMLKLGALVKYAGTETILPEERRFDCTR